MAYRYIAAGVRSDCKKLLEKFEKTKSVRFEQFAKIWKEMQFSCIYCGRESFAELYEFIEEVIKIAKEFFLPPNTFQTRLCGLYLLYGLYYKQPTIEDGDYLVKIRLNMTEWQESCNLMEGVREQHHYDALYIFNKLLAGNAFHFCAMPREYGLEKSIRKYLERGDNANEDLFPKSDILMLEESGMLSSLEEVCNKYYSLKCALNKDSKEKKPESLLNYVSPKLVTDLRSIIQPLTCKSVGNEDKDNTFDIGAHRRKLREKAASFAAPGPSTSK